MLAEYVSTKTHVYEQIFDNIAKQIKSTIDGLSMPEEVKIRALQLLKSNIRTISMTTPDVAAGTCIIVAVLSLQLKHQFQIHKIAKFLGVSSSSITSRTFKLLASRNIHLGYRIQDIALQIPSIYPALVGKTGITFIKEPSAALVMENPQE